MANAGPAELYEELLAHLKKVAVLSSCSGVLSWDEQTYLPRGGAEHRADQLGLLAGMTHEWATSPRIGEILDELEGSDLVADATSSAAVNIREARRDYTRATCLPRRLVEELSRVATLSQQQWVESRKAKEFAGFAPWLEKIVALKQEEAQAVGFAHDGQPYDALLDEYEPGATSAWIAEMFSPLREALVPLVQEIADSGRTPNPDLLTQNFPIDAQRRFGLSAAGEIGFDFDNGRLDEAAHPFCSGVGPGDCRLTTRYDAHHFPGAFFGTLHEAGHGIYEQGLQTSAFGTAMGHSTSLGIHESQSRMWENLVGRSRPFWTRFFPQVQEAFSDVLGGTTLDEFYAAINDVRPSFIRVEADEATYNLHIMLRFEMEPALISGDLKPADVPAAWDEIFVRDFGLTPESVSQGCLQDIHWSAGLIGYFPTYALGNMYASQFFAAAREELGDLDGQLTSGEFAPLRQWLNTSIHERGKQYRARDLVEVVTGRPLSHQPLVDHLRSKYGELYGLNS